MFLLITAFAAVVSTIIWYFQAPEDKYKLNVLCFIFWGATLMWFADHVIAYLIDGGEFLEVSPDATLLGVAVVLLGLFAWMIVLLINDPKGVIHICLNKNKK